MLKNTESLYAALQVRADHGSFQKTAFEYLAAYRSLQVYFLEVAIVSHRMRERLLKQGLSTRRQQQRDVQRQACSSRYDPFRGFEICPLSIKQRLRRWTWHPRQRTHRGRRRFEGNSDGKESQHNWRDIGSCPSLRLRDSESTPAVLEASPRCSYRNKGTDLALRALNPRTHAQVVGRPCRLKRGDNEWSRSLSSARHHQ